MTSTSTRASRRVPRSLRRGRVVGVAVTVGLMAFGAATIAPTTAGATVQTAGSSMSAHATPKLAPDPGRQLLAWGANSDGQLGDGTTIDDSVAGPVLDGANTSGAWKIIDAGSSYACGIGADDSAYCWGYNRYGQLGNGTYNTTDDSLPARVNVGPARWLSVSAGDNFTCGVGSDDSAYCWGYNSYGELGDGTTTQSSVPVMVVAGPAGWLSVSVGAQSTCGVGTDANAYCWGYDATGSLGNGTKTSSAVPVRVLGGPVAPSGWSAVSVGKDHACGIGLDGGLYCWGDNSEGQLGKGTRAITADDSVPVRVTGGPASWLKVAAGADFTCGLGIDGKVYCWGDNFWGQLGNGTNTDDSVPVPLAPSLVQPVRTISTDGSASSACATTDDSAYCWGFNSHGQLGDRTTTNRNVPVLVALDGPLASGSPKLIAAGGTSTYLVSAFGTAPAFTAEAPPTTGTVGTAYGGYTFTASGTGPITFTKASGTLPPGITLGANGLLSGVPTTAGAYTFTVKASNGINPDAVTSTITITISAAPDPGPGPGPGPTYPPSAPRSVMATPGDAQAVISWNAPADAGSFPVTEYQVQSSPGASSCVAAAPALTCTVTGLANGTAYTFTVRALNGAGWGAPSDPSAAVTPRASVPASMVVAGSRDAKDPRNVHVRGTSTGLEGKAVTPMMRFPGQRQSRAGASTPLVADDGTFTWSRKTGKKVYVYFTHGAVKSNTVVINAR